MRDFSCLAAMCLTKYDLNWNSSISEHRGHLFEVMDIFSLFKVTET